MVDVSSVKRRRPTFSLRMLFVMVTVCDGLAFTLPPVIRWFFPPEPDWDELMRLIQTTIQPTTSTSAPEYEEYETSLIVEDGDSRVIKDAAE